LSVRGYSSIRTLARDVELMIVEMEMSKTILPYIFELEQEVQLVRLVSMIAFYYAR